MEAIQRQHQCQENHQHQGSFLKNSLFSFRVPPFLSLTNGVIPCNRWERTSGKSHGRYVCLCPSSFAAEIILISMFCRGTQQSQGSIWKVQKLEECLLRTRLSEAANLLNYCIVQFRLGTLITEAGVMLLLNVLAHVWLVRR